MQRRDRQELVQLLAPFPGRLELTLRLALICSLTTLVAATYQTPDAALTAYVVFFMNKPNRTTSIVLNVALAVVITVAIGVIFLLTRVVIDEPFWRVTVIAIISLVFLFLASASKLEPIASTLALIIAYALDLLGSAPTAELVTRALLYAWLFVSIPAGISIVVNLFLAPAPRRIAENAMAERLQLSAAILRGADSKERQKFRACLDEGSVEIIKAIKLAGLEQTVNKDDLTALGTSARSTTKIMLLIDMLDREAVTLTDHVCNSIALTMDEMAEILKKGGYPIDISLDIPDSSLSLTPLAAHILADLRQAITEFSETPGQISPPAPKETSGFFVADAFTNPDHLRYALKATAAAMICYLLYSLLNWPGIHTSFLTCYIVSLRTTAETVEKLTLRIAGCLLGAVIGITAIVFVIPHLTSIGELMALVFTGAAVAGWVAAGTPRISYAGFQIAFAFFLCIIQGAKPEFDLVTARDRIIGILLGNVVVYLIFTNLWPVSVKARIDEAAASLLRLLGKMTTTANRASRLLLASESQAALGILHQNLLIAAYEPTNLRPEQSWIFSRRSAANNVGQLIGPLYLNAEIDASNSSDIAHRLDRYADAIVPEPSSAAVASATMRSAEQDHPNETATELRALIDIRLRDLQNAFADPTSEHQTVSHASA